MAYLGSCEDSPFLLFVLELPCGLSFRGVWLGAGFLQGEMLQQRQPRWKVFNCFMFVDGLFRWNDSPYLLWIEGSSCNLAAFPAVAFLLALLDCSHANSLIKVMSSLALVLFHLNGMEQSSAKVRQAGAAPAMLFVAVNVPRRLNRREEIFLVHVEQIRNTQQIDHQKVFHGLGTDGIDRMHHAFELFVLTQQKLISGALVGNDCAASAASVARKGH